MKTMTLTDASQTDAEMQADFGAGPSMELAREATAAAARPAMVLKVYGVMAVTTLLTFTALTTGYQMLFTHPLFA